MTAPKKDKDRVAWNPRTHPRTKPPRLSYQDYTNGTHSGKSSPRTGTTSDVLSKVGQAIGGMTGGVVGGVVAGEVAKTVQDAQTMETGWLRTSVSVKDTVAQPYGVVFHYNPTDVQLGMSVSSDLALGSDPSSHSAFPLGMYGNSVVSVNLYFNRIFDMSGSKNDYPTALGSSPEGEDHWTMIRQLGTQWDVEYLMRAINPNPQKDALLPYKTSDFGVMLPGAVDLHLGPLAWRGVVTSMSVNHVMFTPDYTPIFTTVTISLQRLMTVDVQEEASTSTTDSSSSSSTDDDKSKAAAKKKVADQKAATDTKAAAKDKKKATATNIAKKISNGQISILAN